MSKQNKGITLVALVVTIIVLLILAGVTIATVLGQDGIFQKAEEAKKKTVQTNEIEQIQIAMTNIKTNDFENKVKKGILITNEELETELKAMDNEVTVTGLGTLEVTFLTSTNQYQVFQNGKVISKGEDIGKQTVSDYIIAISDSGNIMLFPNAEKYHPELVEKAIKNLIEMMSNQTFPSITEAKQWLIENSTGEFEGKTPETLSIEEIIQKLGWGQNTNDFMNKKGGYVSLITEPTAKRDFLLEHNKTLGYSLLVALGQTEKAEQIRNMSIEEYLTYSLEQLEEGEPYYGRTAESMTIDDVASLMKGSSITMEDFWMTEILNSLGNETSLSAYCMNAVPFLFPDLQIQTSDNYILAYKNYYMVKENGTYHFNISTNQYICPIEVTVIK